MKGKTGLWLGCALAMLAAVLLALNGQSSGPSQEEERIAQVLSAISGAGRVEVALFYAQESGGFGAAAAKTPTGAVVVAEGAEDVAVRLQLIRAVRTLLSLPESAVDVFVMGEGS